MVARDEEGFSVKGRGLKLDTAEDVEKGFGEAWKKVQCLRYLELEGNTLGVGAALEIGKYLEKHPEFETALWKDLFTGRLNAEIPAAMTYLFAGVELAGAKLQRLELSDNAIGPVGVVGLLPFFKTHSSFSLKELILNNNGLGPDGGSTFANALSQCYRLSQESAGAELFQLRVFECGRNRLEDKAATRLAAFFNDIGSLEEIRMPQNGIRPDGIRELSIGFRQNPHLKAISLNDNTIRPDGAEHLAISLREMKNLEDLNLGDCLLGNEGVIKIVQAVKEGSDVLQTLNLESNEIDGQTAKAVSNYLKTFNNLRHIYLSGNDFGSRYAEEIINLITLGKNDVMVHIDNEGGESDEGDESHDEPPEESISFCTPTKPAFSFTSMGSAPNPFAAKSPTSFSAPVPNLFAASTNSFASTPTPFSATSSSLFGGTPTNSFVVPTSAASPSVFGGTPTNSFVVPTSAASPSVFGGTPTNSFVVPTSAASPSVFGGISASSSIFGGSSTSFSAASPSPSIFGGTSASPSIFGGTSTSFGTTTNSFGATSSLFGATSNSFAATSNTFASTVPNLFAATSSSFTSPIPNPFTAIGPSVSPSKVNLTQLDVEAFLQKPSIDAFRKLCPGASKSFIEYFKTKPVENFSYLCVSTAIKLSNLTDTTTQDCFDHLMMEVITTEGSNTLATVLCIYYGFIRPEDKLEPAATPTESTIYALSRFVELSPIPVLVLQCIKEFFGPSTEVARPDWFTKSSGISAGLVRAVDKRLSIVPAWLLTSIQ